MTRRVPTRRRLPRHRSSVARPVSTKCNDEYAVSKRRETLSAKANTGKFVGPGSTKTTKHSGKDFVYGVLIVTLLAFGAKAPANRTAKWFCCCTSDCDYFYDLTGTEGKDCSKSSIYRHLQDHAIPKDEHNGHTVKDEQTKCISATAARAIKQSFRFLSAHCWFFSVCCWLFVVLMVLSNIS